MRNCQIIFLSGAAGPFFILTSNVWGFRVALSPCQHLILSVFVFLISAFQIGGSNYQQFIIVNSSVSCIHVISCLSLPWSSPFLSNEFSHNTILIRFILGSENLQRFTYLLNWIYLPARPFIYNLTPTYFPRFIFYFFIFLSI